MTLDKKNNRFRLYWILLILLGSVALMQSIRPPLVNIGQESGFHGPLAVNAILKKACYDCHSDQTKLNWYDYIQPAYSIVVADVNAGRAGLNFSAWGRLSDAERKGKLFEVLNQIELGHMPPRNYMFLHKSSQLTIAELNTLKDYVKGLITDKPADSALTDDANRQFNSWSAAKRNQGVIARTITGIPYNPEYRNWKVINFIDRLDNNSLRIIFGNAAAIKAARENKTNPWPEGTVFAKVMWDRLLDGSGQVTAGSFKQVEFMIKDKKYKKTGGWGWARFKTIDLLPYGKNSDYATECINCHKPVANFDLVFTKPVKF